MNQTNTQSTNYYSTEEVHELIDSLENQISNEDMLGTTREMVVEGTFARIRRELNELPTTEQ